MQDHNDEEPSQPPNQRHPIEVERLGQPPRAGGRRTSHRRLWGLVVLALAAVVAVILATVSGGSPPVPRASAQGAAPAQQVDALLAGIPQAGDALGSPAAPVTLEFFGDLQCPTSRAFTLVDLPSLISRWVRSGQLRVEYRSLQTATRQPAVFMVQQAAALAAGMQGKGWYFIELFYHEQGREDTGYVTDAYLDHLAAQIPGLSVALWGRERQEPPLAARVASDEQTAARLDLHETPALLVGRTGADSVRIIPGFFLGKPTALYAAIEGALAQVSRSHSTATTAAATAGRRSFADWAGGLRAPHDAQVNASC